MVSVRLKPSLLMVCLLFSAISLVSFSFPFLETSTPIMQTPNETIFSSSKTDDFTSSYNDASSQMMGFIKNEGQISNSLIEYYFASNNYLIGFSNSKIHFQINSNTLSQIDSSGQPLFFEISFFNSHIASPVGINQLSHSTNFFIGDNQFLNIPSFNELMFYDLYVNIDLRYYITSEGVKYDFIVHPGGNPADIQIAPSENIKFSVHSSNIEFIDSDGTNILSDDNLSVFTSDKTPVEATFQPIMDGRGYQILVDSYDTSQDLIIDPLWMFYSTFIGGVGNDVGNAIVVDDSNQAIITGYTTSSEASFPIMKGYDETYNSNEDVYIIKMNSTGNGLIFATYIGGSSVERARAITLDQQNNIYITGYTSDYIIDYPVVNAYDDTLNGGNDIFVSKLNSTGNGLIFSTYFGGASSDDSYGIKVDSVGNIYIAGITNSDESTFPLLNAYNSTYGGGSDAFIAKFNSSGNGLIYSTYVGNTGSDIGYGIEIDINGNAYITGSTNSLNFPLSSPVDSTFGPDGTYESFILGLNSAGNGILFSTFLGGSGDDTAYNIDLDPNGNIYVSGSTTSNQASFPLVNSYDNTFGAGVYDVFVAKLNSSGTGIVYSTYLGGDQADHSYGLVVDDSGNAIVTGHTRSDENTFPVSNTYDGTANGGIYGDVFVTKINSVGDGLIYSTFIGGSDDDISRGIALDSLGDVYLTGETKSSNFPVKNAFDNSLGLASTDAFLTKISGLVDNSPPLVNFISPMNNTDYYSSSIDLTYTVSDVSPYSIEVSMDNVALGFIPTGYTFDGLTNGLHNITIKVTDSVNLITSKSHNFTIDTNGPSVNILNPIDTYISSSTPAISYYITNQSDLNIQWYVNEVLVPNIANGSLISLNEGENNITVTVVDQQSRATKDEVLLVVDTINPSISINAPLNQYYNDNSISLQYSIDEINLAFTEVYLDDTLNESEIPFNTILLLSDGLHNITIVVEDLAGNRVSIEKLFTVDTVPPSITITSPETSVTGTSTVLTYDISDLTPIVSVKIYINDVLNSTDLNSGSTINLPSVGTYNITIVAIDSVNNIGIETILVDVSVIDVPSTTPSTSSNVQSPSESSSQVPSSEEPTTNNGIPILFPIFLITLSTYVIIKRKIGNTQYI